MTTGLPEDALSAEQIGALLAADVPASCLHVYDSVGSTNDVAKEMAMAGAPPFTAVIAESQTMGKGRRGRSFYSPPASGIYLSMVLRPSFHEGQMLLLTTGVAVAACRAIERVCPCQVQIKWVNDLYLRGRKIAGILVEAVSQAQGAGASEAEADEDKRKASDAQGGLGVGEDAGAGAGVGEDAGASVGERSSYAVDEEPDQTANDSVDGNRALESIVSAQQEDKTDAGKTWDTKENDYASATQQGSMAVSHLIVGVGINVKQSKTGFPPDLAEKASVLCENGEEVSRNRLAAALIDQIWRMVKEMEYTPEATSSRIVREATRRSFVIGKEIRIDGHPGVATGIAVGLDALGALIVEGTDGRRHKLNTGEISIIL
ncbi:MAG: biotin--[acetyl-CoA-carboxylase] ligase [Clostridiales bacterium]|nr:biotin--[acetyl-CoA-carboxylase] ligase [Clostridiales bacterium]